MDADEDCIMENVVIESDLKIFDWCILAVMMKETVKYNPVIVSSFYLLTFQQCVACI